MWATRYADLHLDVYDTKRGWWLGTKVLKAARQVCSLKGYLRIS
jgi:hypothetical protein